MSVKQDRQGARTPTDLERKYNFDTRFADIMGAATDARTAAEKAQNAAEEAQNNSNNPAANLTHEEVFNLLTKNGAVQGIYRGDDGEVYINASYLKSGIINADLIKAGILQSSDGTVQVDLINNKITIATIDSAGFKGRIELSAMGINGYGWHRDKNDFVHSLEIDPGSQNNTGASLTRIASPNDGGGIVISGDSVLVGSPNGEVLLRGERIMIDSKTVSWKDNGDGTFTLIGT